MSTSIERLRRWILLAAALLVIVIAAYFIVRSRLQRAISDKEKDALHQLGLDIVSETNDFTVSQSGGPDGKTIFTIRASKEITHRNGQMTLRDVSITLYGRKHDREDHISGAEFQYDQGAGIVKADGEVHIDLQAPTPEPKPGSKPRPQPAPGPNAETGNIIHVRTHGLTFWQKMGIAATSQPLDFQVHGITGSAVGAEYSSDTGLLVLQSQVKAAGLANGHPIQLDAAHAELNRSTERAVLRQAHYTGQRAGSSTPEKASADEAILLLRQDGTPRHIDASGDVTLEPSTGVAVHSAKMAVDLNDQDQPTLLHAFDGVRYSGDEPLRKGDGSAQQATVWFADHGIAQRMVATGKVHLTQRSHATASDPWITRSLTGDEVDTAFAPIPGTKQVQVSSMLSIGSARIVTQSTAAPKPGAPRTAQPITTTTTLSANRIDTKLLGTPDGLAHLHGEGGAEMQQTSSDGSLQDNRGDAMDVVFHPQQPRGVNPSADTTALTGLVSASLQGHVIIAETPARKPGDTKPPVPGSGSASRADYDAAQDRLTLTGNAQWSSQGNAFWASRISNDRATGDSEAQGAVKASLIRDGAPAGTDATHVIADHARLHQSTQTADFFGSATTPARMWQDGSQVEAPILILEQTQQRLTARGDGPGLLVHSVFEGTQAPPANAKPGAKPRTSVFRIASHELVYSDAARLGNLTGGVQVDSADGSMTAQRADVWLQPATTQPATKSAAKTAATGMFSGSVDHVIATGRVRLTQPGRRGAGEQLVYTAADQRFVLTGTPSTPPTIIDQRGATTGTSLIFHSGDDSVEVLGGPAGSASQEVHTETRVKPRTRQP